MIWHQRYLLLGCGLGFSAFLAALPIFTLLSFLGILRKPAWMAGTAGLVVTILLALGGYHMPATTAASAAAEGVAFGLFPISWIVFWALALFRVTVESGKFEVIRDSLGRLTLDPRLQALLIAFAFGAFLEGAAGFGAPVAIAGAMLTGLGFSPFRAAALCLLANTAPVAFGSIGIPVITLAGTTGLPLARLSAVIGLICTPMAFILPAYLLASTGGTGSLSGVWLPVLVAGFIFSGVQFAVSNYLGPQLTDILAAISTLTALIMLFRFWHPRDYGTTASIRFTSDPHSSKGPRLTPTATSPLPATSSTTVWNRGGGSPPGVSTLGIATVLYAWSPFGLLVMCVLLWGYKPIQTALSKLNVVFQWPYLHDVVRLMPPIVASPTPYHALFNLNWFAAAGTACMVATLLSATFLRMSPRRFLRLLLAVARQLMLPTVTVTSVLAIAFLMNYCGATETLGMAFAATGAMFPFFSALLGWLGVFLTGSDTSANALFGNLQVVTAGRLGLDPVLMASANSVGGVMGKMISLQTIAVAAAATGMSVSDQGRLFRFTLKHSILLASIVGCLAMLFAYVLHWA
jgi:L-lactate transport